MSKNDSPISIGDASIFQGDFLMSLSNWQSERKRLQDFKHLLVNVKSKEVVAATTSSDRLALFTSYQDYVSNDSSVGIKSIDADDFYTTPTWPRVLGLEDGTAPYRSR